MRKFKTRDAFAFARLLKRMDFKEKMKGIAVEGQAAKNEAEYGVDVIWAIIDSASNAGVEEMLYSFLAPVLEVERSEVENMEIDKLVDSIFEMISINDFGSFFKRASGLIQ